jgi:hypothetical protein
VPTIFEAVDEILQAVEDAAPGAPGVPTRDRVDVALLSAYGRAFRCLHSIRLLAERGDADDAAILTRSLVSIALRSLYLVQPDYVTERNRRLAQLAGRSRREGAAMLREMRELGFPNVTAEEVEAASALADEHKWAGSLLPDQKLATMVGMAPYYSLVYRETSDPAHFGIHTLLAGFDEEPTSVTGEGASIALHLVDHERARRILAYAALTYGEYLSKCDDVVQHGVTERVEKVLRDWHTSEPPTA